MTRKEFFETLKKSNFISDAEKMDDFLALTKKEFLLFYSYITEDEYNNTNEIYDLLHKCK